jgi:FkbM family methyltransferase
MKWTTRSVREAIERRLTKRLLGRHARAIVAEAPTGLFAVDPEDVGYGSVGKALLRRGGYGANEIAILTPHLGPNVDVLVVGAHIGTLVVPLSRLCRRIVAIEANPATYRLLLMSLALNGVANCATLNRAASDEVGQLQFLASRANSGGSKRLPKIRDPLYYQDNPTLISVDAVRLDDEAVTAGPFDVIVMDIEGSEFFALRGMPRLLAGARILQIEFLPHHLRNVGGVSIEDFVAVLSPHFDRLTIPSRQIQVEREGFLPALREMYERDLGDGGILFEKAAPPAAGRDHLPKR